MNRIKKIARKRQYQLYAQALKQLKEKKKNENK